MNFISNALYGAALSGNMVVGAGLLCCSYSQFLSPVSHPILSCLNLFFPFFFGLNLFFLLFWILFRWRFALVPALFFLMGWGSVRAYTPINFDKEPRSGKTLKFLTYNVMGMIQEEKDTINPIVEYIRESEADVVCLQEYPVSKKQIKEELSFYPYIETFSPRAGNGMACLSRYPIVSVEQIDYKSEMNGSFLLLLKMDEDTLAVVCNHLESNKMDSHDKEMYENILKSPNESKMKSGGKHLLRKLADAVAIRAPQADSVALAIEKNRRPYMLVCGDFNDSPLSYAHHVISKGLQDAYIEAGFGPGFSYNRNFLYFRIDHILVSEGFRVLNAKVDNSISDSDHYPLWCVVEKL